jgi:hypothetical protein
MINFNLMGTAISTGNLKISLEVDVENGGDPGSNPGRSVLVIEQSEITITFGIRTFESEHLCSVYAPPQKRVKWELGRSVLFSHKFITIILINK